MHGEAEALPICYNNNSGACLRLKFLKDPIVSLASLQSKDRGMQVHFGDDVFYSYTGNILDLEPSVGFCGVICHYIGCKYLLLDDFLIVHSI